MHLIGLKRMSKTYQIRYKLAAPILVNTSNASAVGLKAQPELGNKGRNDRIVSVRKAW